MPTPETIAAVKEQLKTAEAGISAARQDAARMRAAGLTAHAQQIENDIKQTEDRIRKLRSAYSL